MSGDQMLACSDASDSEAEAGLPYSDSLGGCSYSEGYSSPELARLSGQALIVVVPPCEIPSVLQNLSKTHSRSLQDAINVAQVARRR